MSGRDGRHPSPAVEATRRRPSAARAPVACRGHAQLRMGGGRAPVGHQPPLTATTPCRSGRSDGDKRHSCHRHAAGRATEHTPRLVPPHSPPPPPPSRHGDTPPRRLRRQPLGRWRRSAVNSGVRSRPRAPWRTPPGGAARSPPRGPQPRARFGARSGQEGASRKKRAPTRPPPVGPSHPTRAGVTPGGWGGRGESPPCGHSPALSPAHRWWSGPPRPRRPPVPSLLDWVRWLVQPGSAALGSARGACCCSLCRLARGCAEGGCGCAARLGLAP